MKKFVVRGVVVVNTEMDYEIVVEADSDEEAREIVVDMDASEHKLFHTHTSYFIYRSLVE
jgi:hypothetical protein